MTEDAKMFKDIVQGLLYKNSTDGPMPDTAIDDLVNKTFSAKEILGLNLTEEEKVIVRNELLSDNKIQLERGVAIVPKSHKEWFVQKKGELNLEYWDRYRQYLLKDKGFQVNVVAEMDEVSDDIVDLLGDPKRDDEREQRRGLIIGDVQSGKTANYSGIICKAVDAGFRTVVLMTGTTNDLRRQTQVRLDEAFIGVPSGSYGKRDSLEFIGAGKYNRKLRPHAMTTVEKDFSISAMRQQSSALSRDENDKPMLFVIKKNVSVLRNMLGWIKQYNQIATNKIDNSILMIDDEADYASLNTNSADRDPTKTNYYISELLNVFRFASYAGFTATPYANVFIDPATDEEMEKEGLFPKDYIYSLNAPDNYIGARDIFPTKGKYHNMLRTIKDGEKYYPSGHKQDHDFNVVSDSLREAVNTFLLANAIRDLRGDITSHRSMMINVTRFVNTQQLLQKAVSEYMESTKRSIKNYASLPAGKALQDEHIHSLYETFGKQYSRVEFSWAEIQKKLFDSVLPIQVLAVHGKGDDLNYDEHEGEVRAIVIGGQRLSRGLTLEGLIVSYLYRNSMSYDTLMQMGRWFGYRKGYDDICRIWMNKISQEWYAFISESTDELRREVKRMRDRKATPLDFGLKVREDPDIPLIVTARNKMRTAKAKTISVSLSGEVPETPFIHNNAYKNNKVNLPAVLKLVNSVEFKPSGKQYGAEKVKKDEILDLLGSIDVPTANTQFDPQSIASFIRQYAGSELSEWDVVILSGENKKTYPLAGNISVYPNMRQFDMHRGVIRINGPRRRLGSREDPKFGLSNSQINLVNEKSLKGGKTQTSAKDYFKIDRKPLLMIYFVTPKKGKDKESEDYDKLVDFQGVPLIGFGIGIPPLGDIKTKFIRYQINKIHQDFGGIEEYEDEE